MPKGKRFAHNAPPLQEIGRWLRYICSQIASTLARKVLQLDLELEQSVIGISSALRPWQVAYHINQHCGFDLRRDDDLELLLGKQKIHSCFQKFSFVLLEAESILYLVANAGSEGKLVPELGNSFDYFLLFDEIPGISTTQELLRQLKSAQVFTLVLPVEVNEKLRSKQHLVF